jgi:RNA recognition motif-containing protein
LDTTVEEVKEVFTKCGVIMEDISTGQPKIKLYKDESGTLKGDALITFFKEESVPLAINLLDDAEFRLGDASTKIHVQQVGARTCKCGFARSAIDLCCSRLNLRREIHQRFLKTRNRRWKR